MKKYNFIENVHNNIMLRTNKTIPRNRRIKYNPGAEEIKKAVEKFLTEGGQIEMLDSQEQKNNQTFNPAQNYLQEDDIF